MHVRRLTKDNKEDEELVDIVPHWGESCISCVMVDLCIMLYVSDVIYAWC